MHGFKRNANLMYVVMNNGIYGLTKGQDSPTKEVPVARPEESPLDVMMLGLSIQSTTFLARAITTRSEQLSDLMLMGLNHAREGKGMAFIEVLSPCVTYNDTYSQWMNKVYDLDADPDYRNDDLIYHGEHSSLQSAFVSDPSPFHSLEDQYADRTQQHLEDVLSAYDI